jgi:hypothetical protein
MKKIAIAAALCLLAGTTFAQAESCKASAKSKDGKPLAGAALTSYIKKCEADAASACEKKAVSKDGKPLAGAAKSSFVKKCVTETAG